MEVEREEDVLVLRAKAAELPGASARLTLGLVTGVVAADTDEDLMHEDLSRYSLDPSGYSGRFGVFRHGGPPTCWSRRR